MRSVSWTESTEAAKKKHKKGEKKEKSGPPQQMKSCNLHVFFHYSWKSKSQQYERNSNLKCFPHSHKKLKIQPVTFFWSVETVIVDGLKICPSSSNKWAEVTNLDTDISSRLKGRVQVRKRVLVKRIVHHHFCSHPDEVCANCFGDEWEGARGAQIAFNHLLERNARRQH